MKIIYLSLLFVVMIFFGFLLGKERASKAIHDYYQPELSQSYIDNLALKDSIAKLNSQIEDIKHWCK